MFKRGPLEIEFEWDHGPDLTIVFYGYRTHIVSASWSAYPVLGGIKDKIEKADGVFDHDARTLKLPNEGLYELTFYPPGDEGMRRLMEQLPVPPKGMRLSVKGLMDAVYRSVGMDRPPYVSDDDGDFVA